MNIRPWEQVRAILEDALELAPADRPRFLVDACAGDPELQREVEQYLSCEEAASQSLPISVWAGEQAGEAALGPEPERIGGYRIVRRIGEGGMGVVYLAERDDGEYRQEVALKVLIRGVQQHKLLRLFRNERQILAQLQHPNIVRLLDGGTDRGQIYYVMEYVEGTPVTEYCTKHGLTLRQRLDLFCRVCDAVGYAHRKLIIHRDLKPGNVLVTAAGVPKLLDFGLAKAFQEEAAHGDASVSIGAMLTPAYASPEQVRGERLSVATDVYSLGVLLYELLTNRNPHLDGEKSPIEVCRTICDQDPCPPSQASEPRLKRQLAGDLDNIVLMALRKEPECRYGSVDELRQDIERYLGGFAVRASRGSARYHCRKYLLRHRWGAAVSALGGVAALFAAVTIWWEGHQAKVRFNDVRSLAHSVIFELHDAIQDLPGSTTARKLLVDRGLQYLNILEKASGRDVALQWELAEAYHRIGNAEGNGAYSNLGDTPGALESYDHARRLLSRILASSPDNVQAMESLARLDVDFALVLRAAGRSPQSVAMLRESNRLYHSIAARDARLVSPGSLALSQWNLATNLTELQDWAGAVAAWKETLSCYEAIAKSQPADLDAQRNLALSHKRLAAVYAQQGDNPNALSHYTAAEAIDGRRLAAQPSSAEAKMDLSFDLNDLGMVLNDSNRRREALEKLSRALALRREVAAADPRDRRAQAAVARTLDRLGDVYEDSGELAAAIDNVKESVAVLASLTEHDPANANNRKEYGLVLEHLGSVSVVRAESRTRSPQAQRADWRAALAAYERAATTFASLGNGVFLTPRDRSRIAGVAARLERCRLQLRGMIEPPAPGTQRDR